MFTLDASVCARTFTPIDPDFAECDALLSLLQATNQLVIAPNLLLVEIAATASRVLRDPFRARLLSLQLQALPNFRFVPLDADLTQQASELAADYRLRGADAVYAAVARHHGTTLVTLDTEQRTRVARMLRAITPAEAIADLSSTG